MTDDPWRPACGGCGSTSIRVSTGTCDDCGAPWDGSETGEPVRDELTVHGHPGLTGVLQSLRVVGIEPTAVHEQAPGETDAEFNARVLASFEDPRKGTV